MVTSRLPAYTRQGEVDCDVAASRTEGILKAIYMREYYYLLF